VHTLLECIVVVLAQQGRALLDRPQPFVLQVCEFESSNRCRAAIRVVSAR
jgi:hypothetical protein